MENKNRIEVGLHFAPEDMRWKLAQEMAGGTINWRGIIIENSVIYTKAYQQAPE